MARRNQVNTINESKQVVPLNTWILISNLKLAYHMLRRPDGTFNRVLSNFLERRCRASLTPMDGVYSFDTVIENGKAKRINLRLYIPTDSSDTQYRLYEPDKTLSETKIVPIIVFFHGGSFAHSSVDSCIYDTLCRRIAGISGAVVVSVDYRRSPENRYPAAYEDGWEALKWVHSRKWLRSGKDSKIYVYLAGDSSGGNIAHHVAVRAAGTGVELRGTVLLNPMFGGEERTGSELNLDGRYFVTVNDRDWYWRAFLPEGENRDHPACNIFGPRGAILESVKLPTSLVVISGLDLSQDWQLKYVEGLRRSGKDVNLLFLEKATVGFYFMPNTDYFFILMEQISKFVNANG